MKCDLCLFRVNCLIDPSDCGITAVDDDEGVGDKMPHPTEITFDLRDAGAKFIGNQLLVWVSEKTLRALASMRKVDFHGTDAPGEYALLGFLNKTSICFLTKTPEE